METPLSGARLPHWHRQHHTAVSQILSGDRAWRVRVRFGLTFLAAAPGGLAWARAAPLYDTLQRPRRASPASVFGLVWRVLYVLMATAACLAWRHRHAVLGVGGLLLCSVALAPNALWSWLFLHWPLGLGALVDISALGLLVGLTACAFRRRSPLLGLLMPPLWAWLSIAGVLNAVVWQTNPERLG